MAMQNKIFTVKKTLKKTLYHKKKHNQTALLNRAEKKRFVLEALECPCPGLHPFEGPVITGLLEGQADSLVDLLVVAGQPGRLLQAQPASVDQLWLVGDQSNRFEPDQALRGGIGGKMGGHRVQDIL
jgi:hypothetical protein